MKKYFRVERITEDEFITATGFEADKYGQTTVITDNIIYIAVESNLSGEHTLITIGQMTLSKYLHSI